MTRTASLLTLAALLLAPGLASARGAPATTDQARLQAAGQHLPAAPAAMEPAGPIASTDLARAAVEAALQPDLAVVHVMPAGPILTTDDARAAAGARTKPTLVSAAFASSTAAAQ